MLKETSNTRNFHFIVVRVCVQKGCSCKAVVLHRVPAQFPCDCQLNLSKWLQDKLRKISLGPVFHPETQSMIGDDLLSGLTHLSIPVAISSTEWSPSTPLYGSHSVNMQSEKWGRFSHFVVNHRFLAGFR